MYVCVLTNQCVRDAQLYPSTSAKVWYVTMRILITYKHFISIHIRIPAYILQYYYDTSKNTFLFVFVFSTASETQEDRRISQDSVTIGSLLDEEQTEEQDQEDDEGATDEREI